MRIKRYLGGVDDETGNTKSEEIILEDLIDFGKDFSFDEDVEDLTDDEIKAIIDRVTKGNQTIIKAMWQKPNWFQDILKLSNERGIIPAESRLGKRLSSSIDEMGEFKDGTLKTLQFTDLDLKDNLINEIYSEIKKIESKNKTYNSPNKPSKFEIFQTISKSSKSEDNVPMVETNFNPKIDKEEKLYFRIYLNTKLDETEELTKYDAKIYYKTESKKGNPEIGRGIVEVKKNKKKEKK